MVGPLELLDLADQVTVHGQLLLGDLLRGRQVLPHVVGLALAHRVLQLGDDLALDRDQRRLLLHALQVVVKHLLLCLETSIVIFLLRRGVLHRGLCLGSATFLEQTLVHLLLLLCHHFGRLLFLFSSCGEVVARWLLHLGLLQHGLWLLVDDERARLLDASCEIVFTHFRDELHVISVVQVQLLHVALFHVLSATVYLARLIADLPGRVILFGRLGLWQNCALTLCQSARVRFLLLEGWCELRNIVARHTSAECGLNLSTHPSHRSFLESFCVPKRVQRVISARTARAHASQHQNLDFITGHKGVTKHHRELALPKWHMLPLTPLSLMRVNSTNTLFQTK